MAETRFLVIDSNEGFTGALKSHFEAMGVPADAEHPSPVSGVSVRDAQKLLSNRDYPYAAVFVNPNVGHPTWVACVKSAHQYRAGIPCFVIFDNPPSLSAHQIKQLGVTGFIPLPLDYETMMEYVAGTSQALPTPTSDPDLTPLSQGGAGQPSGPAPREPKKSEYTDDDFISIDIKERIGKTNSLFDIFVKLSDGRFVQVVREGDTLTQDRLDKYKAHGAEALFIPKNQQRQFLEFCDKIVIQFLQDPNAPIERKVTEISRYGAESLEFLKSAGFQTPNLERAEKFVQRVTEGVLQVGANSTAVKTWIENAALMEHSVGVATITGLFLKHIGVIKPETYQAVGMAAFLHDLGLVGMPLEFMEEDESAMTPDQKAAFRRHPVLGARKLIADPHPPPAGVIKAVEQHHLRINGGYPESKGMLELSPIAEIIGLANEFCRLIRKAAKDKKLNPLEGILKAAEGNFSPAILRGLKATLRDK